MSALNRAIAGVLERAFPLAWISGEVSNFTRAASGHWYFSIKDASAQIRCVMFRGRAQYADFLPREGDRIDPLRRDVADDECLENSQRQADGKDAFDVAIPADHHAHEALQAQQLPHKRIGAGLQESERYARAACHR